MTLKEAASETLSSASNLERDVGLSHDDAVNLRLAIKEVLVEDAGMVVCFYSGTRVGVHRLLPPSLSGVPVRKVIGNREVK